MATNLERYEILKRHLPQEAARVIAEAFPPVDQLVTRDYLNARLASTEASMHRWMLTMMVSLIAAQFVGVAGIIVGFC